MSNGTTTWTYTYDADGMRTSRTDETTTYTYVYSGSQLTWMTIGTTELQFSYDANGRPLALVYNGIVYYYALNLQGDVVAILNMDGDPVVNYTYDAWGNILSSSGSMDTTLGLHNPLRYRGYVYDQETGLYYLQSRYYNPEWGRFINADALVSTGQGLLGNNMFAYCNNNPVNTKDPSGTIASSAFFQRRAAGVGMGQQTYDWEDFLGAGIVRENKYDLFEWSTIVGAIEYGMSTSKTLEGDVSKPISVFGQVASRWWRITEYKAGIQCNIGNGGFSIAYGPGEEECAFSIGDGWVFEVFSGINKVGFTFTKEADFGAHTGGAYVHAYVRTPTIAAAVLCAIFLPEAFPVVVGATIAS